MEFSIEPLMAYATVLAGVLYAFCEVLKRKVEIPSRYIGLISIGLGLVLGMLVSIIYMGGTIAVVILNGLLLGILIGGTPAGYYSGIKSSLKEEKTKK